MKIDMSRLYIPGYIDEPLPIEEDNSFKKVTQVKILNDSKDINKSSSTIVFRYEYSDHEYVLYNADSECEHEIVGGDNYSGIKCRKCKGWYCA